MTLTSREKTEKAFKSSLVLKVVSRSFGGAAFQSPLRKFQFRQLQVLFFSSHDLELDSGFQMLSAQVFPGVSGVRTDG